MMRNYLVPLEQDRAGENTHFYEDLCPKVGKMNLV